MRLLTIISFIFLFTVSQCARQFNYLECTLANTAKANAVKCDCEALLDRSPADADKDLPQAQLHFHPSLDQYFISSQSLITHGSFHHSITTTYPYLSTDISAGYADDDIRPPRTV